MKTELQDGTYARMVDVPRALEARRYLEDIDVTTELRTRCCRNDVTIRLEAGQMVPPPPASPGGLIYHECTRLSASYLGGTPFPALTGRVWSPSGRRAAAAAAAAFGWVQPPFCPDFF